MSKSERIYMFMLQMLCSDDLRIGDLLPTEVELANQFQVSRPTVMRALNRLKQEGLISRKAGVGSFLERKPENTSSPLVFGLIFPLLGVGEIFASIAEEIAVLAKQYHFTCMWGGKFASTQIKITQMEQMVDFYIQQGVSGVFLAPLEFTKEHFRINRQAVQKLVDARIPVLLIDADYKEYPDRSAFDLVGIDNFRAGYTLAEHFIQQGAARVDFVKPPYSAQTVPQRVRGVQAALLEHGIVPQSAWIHTGEPTDRAFVKKVLESGATNIVSSNDVTAVHVIQQLDQLNVKVPADVRIAGIDDVKYSHFVRISLTTIRQPCQVMGQVAVRTMLERIQSPTLPIRQILLDTELIVRESSQIL